MLAIVIPYFKLTYFEKTLQSLINQTNKKFNVYVGDDSSPENPTQVLAKFETKLNLKYKKFDENYGSTSLSKQWERCIQMTDDENWIMILGDDDVLEKNVVNEFYNSAETIALKKCNVIRFATQKINNDSNLISEIYVHPEIEKSSSFLTRVYAGKSRSSLSEYIFNKKVLLQKGIKNFPVAWHSDIVLVLDVSDFNEVYSINNAIVYVRVSKISISGSFNYIKQKARADFDFGKYLIRNLNRFSKREQKDIIPRIEKLAINNRKQFIFGMEVIVLHIGRLDFSKAVVFIYKSLKK